MRPEGRADGREHRAGVGQRHAADEMHSAVMDAHCMSLACILSRSVGLLSAA